MIIHGIDFTSAPSRRKPIELYYLWYNSYTLH